MGMLHAEEMQRARDAHSSEQQRTVAVCQLLTTQVADGTARINLLEAENASLLRSIDEYRRKMDARGECEAEHRTRLEELTKELDKYTKANVQLQREADAMIKERDALKQEAAARARNWEKLLGGHTDMLALERARSHELGELEKAARSQYDKLERRFKQLERAFEQAVAKNDSLTEQLALEQDAARRSRDTVTELGGGIRKLQSALARAGEYKRSALQLQQTLVQARAENDSLLQQLSVAQQLADQSRTGLNDSHDSGSPAHDTLLLNADIGSVRQRADDLELELNRTTQLLRKSEELADLLSRKADELVHALQVKSAMLNDQAAAIGDLKERIDASEADTINAENVITNLEEQLDNARMEIKRLEKSATEQAFAEAQMRKMMGDYRAAVRQLDQEESSDDEDE